MTKPRFAYMPLATYPESASEASIQAATAFTATSGYSLHVTAFSVKIPHVSSPFGGLFLDVPGLIRGVEEKSKAECERLLGVVRQAAGAQQDVDCQSRLVVVGATLDAAAAEARYFDLAVLPWSADSVSHQDLAEVVVFGSGRPTILVPATAAPAVLDHIAIAWDGSRVAARALGDVLPLLSKDGHVSVLTVQDEKPLSGSDLASELSTWLRRRGVNAEPFEISLGGRSVAEALQDAALSKGARLLAMGGFGHSRLRDLVLGGATKGVFANLRLPVLLSH